MWKSQQDRCKISKNSQESVKILTVKSVTDQVSLKFSNLN